MTPDDFITKSISAVNDTNAEAGIERGPLSEVRLPSELNKLTDATLLTVLVIGALLAFAFHEEIGMKVWHVAILGVLVLIYSIAGGRELIDTPVMPASPPDAPDLDMSPSTKPEVKSYLEWQKYHNERALANLEQKKTL